MQKQYKIWSVFTLPEIFKAFIRQLQLPPDTTIKGVRTFTDPSNGGSVAMEFTMEGEEQLPDAAMGIVSELSAAREMAVKLYAGILGEEANPSDSVSELLEAVDKHLGDASLG